MNIFSKKLWKEKFCWNYHRFEFSQAFLKLWTFFEKKIKTKIKIKNKKPDRKLVKETPEQKGKNNLLEDSQNQIFVDAVIPNWAGPFSSLMIARHLFERAERIGGIAGRSYLTLMCSASWRPSWDGLRSLRCFFSFLFFLFLFFSAVSISFLYLPFSFFLFSCIIQSL